MNGSVRKIIFGYFIKRFCWPHKALISIQPGKCFCSHNSTGANLLDEKFGKRFLEGPTLHDFMNSDGGHGNLQVPEIPYLKYKQFQKNDRKGRLPTNVFTRKLHIYYQSSTNQTTSSLDVRYY